MNEPRLINRLAATDAYAQHLPVPEESWTREVAFSEIERRIGMKTQTDMRTPTGTDRRWRGPIVAAAVAVAVLLVGAGILWLSVSTPADEPGDAPITTGVSTSLPTGTTSAPDVTTVAPPVTVAAATTAPPQGDALAFWQAVTAGDAESAIQIRGYTTAAEMNYVRFLTVFAVGEVIGCEGSEPNAPCRIALDHPLYEPGALTTMVDDLCCPAGPAARRPIGNLIDEIDGLRVWAHSNHPEELASVCDPDLYTSEEAFRPFFSNMQENEQVEGLNIAVPLHPDCAEFLNGLTADYLAAT